MARVERSVKDFIVDVDRLPRAMFVSKGKQLLPQSEVNEEDHEDDEEMVVDSAAAVGTQISLATPEPIIQSPRERSVLNGCGASRLASDSFLHQPPISSGRFVRICTMRPNDWNYIPSIRQYSLS